MTLGDPNVLAGALPAGATATNRQFTCPAACSSHWQEPITVISATPHMHSYGRSMYTTVYDPQGVYQATLNRVQYW